MSLRKRKVPKTDTPTAKREISVTAETMHQNQGVFTNAYPIPELQVNPLNPRGKDLRAAGITLESVKDRQKPKEQGVDEWYEEMVAWCDSNYKDTPEHHDEWLALLSLAVDIHNQGVTQPINVLKETGEIICGERRLLASILVRKVSIPAILSSKVEQEQVKLRALTENTLSHPMTTRGNIIGFSQIEGCENYSVRNIARLMSISVFSAHAYQKYVKSNDVVQGRVLIILDTNPTMTIRELSNLIDNNGELQPTETKTSASKRTPDAATPGETVSHNEPAVDSKQPAIDSIALPVVSLGLGKQIAALLIPGLNYDGSLELLSAQEIQGKIEEWAKYREVEF